MALNQNTVLLNTDINFVDQSVINPELIDINDGPEIEKKKRKLSGGKTDLKAKHKVHGSCGSKCKKECSTHIDEAIKEQINESFWSLSFSEKRLWFDSHILITSVKTRSTAESGHFSSNTLHYSLPVETAKISVCKVMFMAILGLKTDGMITEFVGEKTKTNSSIPDFIHDGRRKAPNRRKQFLLRLIF